MSPGWGGGYYAVTGALLGLQAGFSPGPLMTLIIAESLRGGWRAGFRAALSPLVTDLALISLALLLISPLSPQGLPLVSVAGGCLIIYMGWMTVRTDAVLPKVAAAGTEVRGSLWRGVVTNLFNPNAILFWVVTGAPLLKESVSRVGWTGPVFFALPFFSLLIGGLTTVAVGAGTGGRFLRGSGYRWTLIATGSALALLGLWRVWTGLAELL